jgi:hypothetical protein
MKPSTEINQQSPLKMVGSSTFGVFPKISQEQTWNMIISDNFLVSGAGFTNVSNSIFAGNGRGIYTSINFQRMIRICGNNVLVVDDNLDDLLIGKLTTFTGNVFISDNNAGQICICDLQNIYIFNYLTGVFTQATIDFLPGFMAFQNERFISVDLNTNQWRLSALSDGTSWPNIPQNVGEFQGKANPIIATVPVPGKSNLLFVFGTTEVEAWTDIGAPIFPYQKNTFFNCDYGCLNAATICWNKDMIVWLGGNEKTTPRIMFSKGDTPQEIITDGIAERLKQANHPEISSAILYYQFDHLLYQITLSHPTDNFSFIYDFTLNKIYNSSDAKMNCHPALQVAFFNQEYYFSSFVDNGLYQLSSTISTFDGNEIPRIRVTNPFRLPDSSRFVVNRLDFTLEQGCTSDPNIIDMSVSIDGGVNFSSAFRYTLNTIGHRANRFVAWNLGSANDMTFQFRFYGEGRYVLTDGNIGYFQ